MIRGMKGYKSRIFDALLCDALEAKGAVLVEGAKWCGKTTTAEQIAKSVLYVNDPKHREQYLATAQTNPQRLLSGGNPRLIDEWQIAPELWDAIRFDVDHSDTDGKFVLTGSAVPLDEEAKKKIEEQRKEMEGKEITNLEEQAISLVGRDIYERLIKGYTEKQWGRKCTELPPFIIRRLPVRFVYDNNYFNDSYQGVPIGGYNKLIDGLLEGIDTQVNVDFFEERNRSNTSFSILNSQFENIVFTGRIDEFYDFRYGKLDYRTVRFETETLPTSNYQGLAQINYTEAEIPYTRIIEHKHFESFAADVDKNPQTVISREYSIEWKEGLEPYYPINDEKNNALYQKYEALAQQESNVIFGGRLAEYKYYDMAPIVEKVLGMF